MEERIEWPTVTVGYATGVVIMIIFARVLLSTLRHRSPVLHTNGSQHRMQACATGADGDAGEKIYATDQRKAMYGLTEKGPDLLPSLLELANGSVQHDPQTGAPPVWIALVKADNLDSMTWVQSQIPTESDKNVRRIP